MYTYELFSVEDGFGFRILQDSNIIISQDTMPGVSGFVVMGEDIAIQEAEALISRLEG